jgi:putative transposase
VLRTHKIALDLTNKQRTHLAKCAGVSRFAYNWGLSLWEELYAAHKNDPSLPKPSQYEIRKILNAVKREQFPWMMEVTKCAPQEAIIDLGKAYRNFIAGRGSRPVFHKKGVRDSFRVSSGFFVIEGDRLRLPHIGWLRMREVFRYKGAEIISLTISRRAGRWYASIACEILYERKEEAPRLPIHPRVCGVDAGVNEYVDSSGARYEVPRSYRVAERRLRRMQKALSRKQKGSRNRAKARLKVAKLHARTADIRQEFLHQLTTRLIRQNDLIAIEDLNVKGMMKNRYLAKSIADASFGEFRRQLSYKAENAGTKIIVAERFFPSSKMCSECGAKTKRLPLSIRSWTCGECGTRHDRDLNAAINLKRYAESSAVSACGEFSASATTVKPPSAGQPL